MQIDQNIKHILLILWFGGCADYDKYSAPGINLISIYKGIHMTEKPTYEELEKIANERGNLKKQLKLLSLAVNQSSEGIAVIDPDGNLEYSNNAFAKMHGYSAEELVGKKISIFHTPEQMPHVEAVNLEIKQTGSFKGEIWHVKREGTVFPTIMHNSLILDEANKPIGIMGTLRDISDIKQTDEALRNSEHKLSTHLQNTQIGAISWDLNFNVTEMLLSGTHRQKLFLVIPGQKLWAHILPISFFLKI